MERMVAQAVSTAIERKLSPSAAEATVLERMQPFAPPKKSNTGMMIGIAAAIVVVLGIAGAIIFKPTVQTPTVAGPTAGTSVTATAAATTTTPIPAGQGVLLLSASPWGNVEKIVDDKGMQVDLSDDKRSTPTRIELAPGTYSVTMSGPARTETFPVQVVAGRRLPVRRDLGVVDFNELEKELQKP